VIKQVKVTLANEAGTLSAMVGALGDAGVDIKALEVNETSRGSEGEAHLIVNDVEKARAALEAADQRVAVEDAVVVEMADRPGGLAEILRALAGQGHNIRYLYAFVTRLRGRSLAVFTVERPEDAARDLAAAGFTLVSQGGLAAYDAPRTEAPSLEDHLGVDFIW